MAMRRIHFLILLISTITFSGELFGQNEAAGIGKTMKNFGLFDTDELLHLKLSGRLNELYTDRKDNMAYHPFMLQYWSADSVLHSIHIRAKARGNFRRLKENCKLPPLLLNFPKTEKLGNTIFIKQNKLKLVMPCQGDEYVVREWLVYKLYNLFTQKSFRARLAQVEFEDSAQQRRLETYYCILIEDENEMALRNHTTLMNARKLPMDRTNRDQFTMMAVFQYMIANTDWSVPYMQNIKLLTSDSGKVPVAVPYDFDHAGLVSAPYAGAAPELEISSIRERIYRGYCNPGMMDYIVAFKLFNEKKKEVYDTFTSCSYLNSKYLKFATRFLDDFYNTIDNPKSIEEVFNKPCRTNVRVELKGLKD